MDKEEPNNKILEYQKELIPLIQRHIISDGENSTAIPSLSLIRASNTTEPIYTIYEPSLCIIAQGTKLVMLANESYQYDIHTYMVASVQLPICGQVIEADPQKPYLCVRINFSISEIVDILGESNPVGNSRKEAERGLYVNKMHPSLLDAVLRLVLLLDSPQDISGLSPLFMHEILYRVLHDDNSELIRQFAIFGSHADSIAKVIQIINQNFSKSLRIEDLAKEVNMSSSALHIQFKKVTAMSPLQYQKKIRLQKARRLLLSETIDASTVAYQVGYESPSQFSREYVRMFGLPPLSDVKRHNFQ
jgi:AraC-type DNA-binding domain-containing proteins